MATANGGDGVLRPRARESEGETGESEREQGESGRAAGVVHAARRASASRRWPRGRARASTQQLRGVGRKTTGSYSAGLGRLLAGPASWLGCTGRSPGKLLPFIFFCFLISDICFDLNNILNHLFNLCQFLQELDILFQSSPTGGIIFGHILIYITNIFPMQIFMH